MEAVVRYKGMSLTARQKVRRSKPNREASPAGLTLFLRLKNEATLRAYSM